MGFLDNIKEKQAELKEKQAEIIKSRGKELGYLPIGYMGGFDDLKRRNAKLRFYENQIEYSSLGQPVKGLVIKASDVVGIEVSGQQQTNSRISVTRMATLGVFSLAAPKRTTKKEASVTISLKDGRQVYFFTKLFTESQVHQKLANAISHFHSLQVSQSVSQQTTGQIDQPVDNAREIMKYSILQKKGIITEEEFQAKKKQILDL